MMRRLSLLERRQALTAWLFLAPSLVVVALVAGYPLYRTIALSFTDTNILEDRPAEFVGWQHYRDLWGIGLTDEESFAPEGAWFRGDHDWLRAIRNTLVFTVVSITLETLLGLLIALLVHSELRGRGVMRAAMLVPWAIPTVVSAQMWTWMLNDQFGVVNDILLRLGVIDRGIAWIASPDTALWTIVAVDVWKTTPFMALLLLAGLQSIPAGLYEAANVDGAGPVRRFFHVTLPLLKPALLVALIFRTLDALRVFDIVQVMMGTKHDTITMTVFARQQMVDFGDFGYGSAISTSIFLMIGVFTAAYVVALRVEVD